MRFQTSRVEEAVGKVLSHDLTKVVKGEFKVPPFKKGHASREEDIPKLLKLGKNNGYIHDLESGEIHEDEADIRIGNAVAGSGVTCSGPRKSRVVLAATCSGLLKINLPALEAVNEIPNVILATLPNNTVVQRGDRLGETKVIPPVVPEVTLTVIEDIGRQAGWVVKVVPFQTYRVGVIITGNEVYKKRIRDGFGPVIAEKVEQYGSSILRLVYAPDDPETIAAEIRKMVAEGAGMILVTGGMSVDPDDVTPSAISLSGAVVEKYGAPALPGAMFMLAYLGNIPVLGIPACSMFYKITIVDLLLPRFFAGERVTRKDIAALAHGGLCRVCSQCRYPNCTYGKGVGNLA